MKNRRINIKIKDLKVILGCGNTKINGWVGLDIGDYGQEILWDLRDGLPFPDNSCSNLLADQVLEHIQLNEDYIFLMNECLRVLKPQGEFEIKVPYWESESAFKDPTHSRFFSKHTFSYMEKENSWEYGFDKRWKVKICNIVGDSQIIAVLLANK